MERNEAIKPDVVRGEIERLQRLRHEATDAPGDRVAQEDLARRIRYLTNQAYTLDASVAESK